MRPAVCALERGGSAEAKVKRQELRLADLSRRAPEVTSLPAGVGFSGLPGARSSGRATNELQTSVEASALLTMEPALVCARLRDNRLSCFWPAAPAAQWGAILQIMSDETKIAHLRLFARRRSPVPVRLEVPALEQKWTSWPLEAPQLS